VASSQFRSRTPDLSTYYLRYYWWEIIVYNINITGPTNLGPYMRYYWTGPRSIKYAILVGGPSIYNMGYYWLGPVHIILVRPVIYNIPYYWLSLPDIISHITGWAY
jgi:hypothetical protein